jgi:hypothetical protein
MTSRDNLRRQAAKSPNPVGLPRSGQMGNHCPKPHGAEHAFRSGQFACARRRRALTPP